jgi:hydrogenase/urease accessory protein HupE
VLALVLTALLLHVSATAREAEAHPLGLTRVNVTFAPDRGYTVDILVDPESLLAKLEILSGQQPSGIVPIDQLPARIGALRGTLLAQTRVMFDDAPSMPAFTYLQGTADVAGIGSATAPGDRSRLASSLGGANPGVADPGVANPGGASPGGPGSGGTGSSSADPGSAGSGTAAQPGLAIAAPGTAPTAIVRLTGVVPPGATHFRFNYGLVLGSYVLSVRSVNGAAPVTLWIAGGQDTDPIDLTRGLLPLSRFAVARQYFVLGFEHILPKGIDHILFVLGIFLLSTAWRPILLQVTTFTIAHSITLGLTMYGIVSLPSSIVEPLIALSITYVAIENLWTTELKPWRLALVFAFGLLHGMGFAGVLRGLGLPRSEFLTALLTFNLGVEGGQLAVILIALLAVGWWRQRETTRYRQWVVVPASIAIALVGAYWTIVRSIG